jgi:hypothetical protein
MPQIAKNNNQRRTDQGSQESSRSSGSILPAERRLKIHNQTTQGQHTYIRDLEKRISQCNIADHLTGHTNVLRQELGAEKKLLEQYKKEQKRLETLFLKEQQTQKKLLEAKNNERLAKILGDQKLVIKSQEDRKKLEAEKKSIKQSTKSEIKLADYNNDKEVVRKSIERVIDRADKFASGAKITRDCAILAGGVVAAIPTGGGSLALAAGFTLGAGTVANMAEQGTSMGIGHKTNNQALRDFGSQLVQDGISAATFFVGGKASQALATTAIKYTSGKATGYFSTELGKQILASQATSVAFTSVANLAEVSQKAIAGQSLTSDDLKRMGSNYLVNGASSLLGFRTAASINSGNLNKFQISSRQICDVAGNIGLASAQSYVLNDGRMDPINILQATLSTAAPYAVSRGIKIPLPTQKNSFEVPINKEDNFYTFFSRDKNPTVVDKVLSMPEAKSSEGVDIVYVDTYKDSTKFILYDKGGDSILEFQNPIRAKSLADETNFKIRSDIHSDGSWIQMGNEIWQVKSSTSSEVILSKPRVIVKTIRDASDYFDTPQIKLSDAKIGDVFTDAAGHKFAVRVHENSENGFRGKITFVSQNEMKMSADIYELLAAPYNELRTQPSEPTKLGFRESFAKNIPRVGNSNIAIIPVNKKSEKEIFADSFMQDHYSNDAGDIMIKYSDVTKAYNLSSELEGYVTVKDNKGEEWILPNIWVSELVDAKNKNTGQTIYFSRKEKPVDAHKYNIDIALPDNRTHRIELQIPAIHGVRDVISLNRFRMSLSRQPVHIVESINHIELQRTDSAENQYHTAMGNRHINVAAWASDNRISIFSGTTKERQNWWDTVLAHEAGHTYATMKFGNVDPNELWMSAIIKEGAPHMGYGSYALCEDFTVTLELYHNTDGGRLDQSARRKYPERFALLDQMFAGKNVKTHPLFDSIIKAKQFVKDSTQELSAVRPQVQKILSDAVKDGTISAGLILLLTNYLLSKKEYDKKIEYFIKKLN